MACTIATESTFKSKLALSSGIDMVSLEWVGDKSLGEVHKKIIIFSIITEMASPCPLYAWGHQVYFAARGPGKDFREIDILQIVKLSTYFSVNQIQHFLFELKGL